MQISFFLLCQKFWLKFKFKLWVSAPWSDTVQLQWHSIKKTNKKMEKESSFLGNHYWNNDKAYMHQLEQDERWIYKCMTIQW